MNGSVGYIYELLTYKTTPNSLSLTSPNKPTSDSRTSAEAADHNTNEPQLTLTAPQEQIARDGIVGSGIQQILKIQQLLPSFA